MIIREALLAYDSAQDDTEKRSALDKLKKYMNYSTDHNKPNNLKKIKASTVSNKGEASDREDPYDEISEEEDEHLREFKIQYNSEEVFTYSKMAQSLMNSSSYRNQIHQVICLNFKYYRGIFPK